MEKEGEMANPLTNITNLEGWKNWKSGKNAACEIDAPVGTQSRFTTP
jgi:hypothetical protein